MTVDLSTTLRGRICKLMADGRERTTTEVADRLGRNVDEVRQSFRRMTGLFQSEYSNAGQVLIWRAKL